MNPHPLTKRTYLFRSYVRCAICGRRMIGHHGKGATYYRCEARRDDPHILEDFSDHPRSVSVREDVLSAAVEAFFADRIFGEGRARLLAQHFSEAEARAHAEHAQRVANLEARIAAHEQTKRRLVREMATLPDDDDLANTMRGDLREEYYREERARRTLVEELDQLRAQEPPPPEDPALLEELPRIPVTLDGVPEELVRDLFSAFSLAVQYDRLRDEIQLSVTLTDSLATAIRQTDPDDDARAGAVVLPFPVPFAPTPFRNPPLYRGYWGRLRRSATRLGATSGDQGRRTHTPVRSTFLPATSLLLCPRMEAAPGSAGQVAVAAGGGQQLVQVAVLVLQHVRDRGPDRARRPLGPADGQVEVLVAHGPERLPKALARLHQLPPDAGQVPVGRRRVRLRLADVLPVLLAQVDDLAGQGPPDGEVDAVLAVHQVAEELADRAAVAPDHQLQVSRRQRVDDAEGGFPLPVERLQQVGWSHVMPKRLAESPPR